jgi:glycosyltransferase involved in cell wall biosynthesis
MRSVTVVVPGPLDTRTGGSHYDRRMVEGLGRRGWIVQVRELDDSFPFPTSHALQRASEVLADIRSDTLVLVDGLAFGAMPEVVERAADRLRIVALVHLPLASAVGLEPTIAARLEMSERRALRCAVLVVVTGSTALSLMAARGLPLNRVVVVEPGTDAALLARGSGSTDVHLLTVATLSPGKGHEILIEALAAVPTRRWRLTCAGSLTRHPATVDRVRAAISRLGLDERVSLVGDLDQSALAVCHDRADLFVLATLQETYGMAVAEALARGLPVVATATGAIPALVGAGAGVVVPPGDRAALTEALSHILDDDSLRGRLAAGARRARTRLRDWDHAAAQLALALESIDADG